ncbi:MAG: penicillin-binding protein 1C [Chitinophagaceae bacterium]
MISKLKYYFTTLTKKQKIKWGVSVVILIWFWLALPSKLFNNATCFVITDKDGNLLNATIASDGQWRFPFNKNVPEKFEKCITTFEDKRFFYHPGIDPVAFCRAIKQNISNKKTVSGGSTLTMQVMRMQQQNANRNIFNKAKEMIMAVRLECSYKKKTILALYASNAPFGSNVVGLDAAAWRYYGRQPNSLTWGEMAALAVLPNAPALVHPGRNRNELLRKRNELLDKLLANKTIDSTTCQLAKIEPLPLEPKPLPQLAPHLLEKFKKDYQSQKDDDKNTTLIQTTLQANLQQQVTQQVQAHQHQLSGNQIKNVAAMVVEIESGNILAYVGNINDREDSTTESYVDVLTSPRSPGSTLKPLLYASMLSEGALLPRQLIPDIPTQFGGYTPQNFDLGFDGAVPANRALARSLNIPAVKLLQQFKYQKFYDVLKNCGFSTLTKPADHYGMSLILGGCEVTPFELAGVYSSMARMYLHEKKNKGKWNSEDWHSPRYWEFGIRNWKEEKLNSQYPINHSPLFDYPSLYHTFNAMNEVMRPGEEGLWNLFSSSQRIAWKTGTSFGFRDAWAIGLTPKYCVVVWCGNTTGEGRAGLIGLNAAAPLLFNIFRLLPTSNWFNPPTSGFTYIPTCKKSGFKVSSDCADADTILVSESVKNSSTNCPYCRKVHLDNTANFRVTESCLPPSQMQHQSWFILPPTIEYYYRQKHPDYKTLPPYMQGCNTDATRVLDIIYPDENATIYIPIEINGATGSTIFTATHKNSNAKLYWHLDDNFIGTTEKFHQLELNPSIGKHIITIVDETGNSVAKNFEIIKKG